jgi:hypothetical protein
VRRREEVQAVTTEAGEELCPRQHAAGAELDRVQQEASTAAEEERARTQALAATEEYKALMALRRRVREIEQQARESGKDPVRLREGLQKLAVEGQAGAEDLLVRLVTKDR